LSATFQTILLTGTVIIFFAGLRPLSKTGTWVESNVAILSLAFGFVLYFEFFALGPNSFIHLDSEGDYSSPIFNYLSTAPSDEVFSHKFGGGNDLYSMTMIGMQFFSFEKIFFSIFPHWIAVFLHKYLIYLIGFSGTYLLARDSARCSKFAALAIGLFFTVSFFRLIDHSIAHGVGRSLFPLAIYICVSRLDKKNYFLGVLGFSVLAMTVSPTHVFLGLIFSIVAGAILLGKIRPAKIFTTLLILTGVVLLNWHEVIFAMKEMTPYSARGLIGLAANWNAWTALKTGILRLYEFKLPLLISLLCLIVFAARKDSYAIRVPLMLGALLFGYVLLRAFPWDSVNLGFVKGLSIHTSLESITALFIPMAARTAYLLEKDRLAFPPFPKSLSVGGVFLAATVAIVIWYKGLHLSEYLYYGGQSQFHSIENLTNRDWAPDEPFRVITIRHRRPEPMIAAGFYGLDTFDSSVNLTPAPIIRYWNLAIRRSGQSNEGMPRIMLDYDQWSSEKRSLRIDGMVDLDMLGIANVGFVLSPVPLYGGGVEKVSGPDDDTFSIFRGLNTAEEKLGYLRHRLRKIVRYGKVYVYRVPQSLPRVFPATAVKRVADDLSDEALLRNVKKEALKRVVFVRGKEASVLNQRPEGMQVTDYQLVTNGYDIQVDAPDGGVLVVNTAYLPFWKAWADGRPVPVVQANMVHMALAVPPGTKTVKLRYRRPFFRDLLFSSATAASDTK